MEGAANEYPSRLRCLPIGAPASARRSVTTAPQLARQPQTAVTFREIDEGLSRLELGSEKIAFTYGAEI
jgi:hypothetical protein